MSFKVLFESSTTINLKIEGGFDNPKNELRVSQDKLFVSGWFYLPYEKISIIVKSTFDDGTTSEEEHFLNVYRPDVIDHLGLSSKDLTLGFQFTAPLSSIVKVEAFIKKGNTHYQAWTCEKPSAPSSIARSTSEICWQKIHCSERIDDIVYNDYFFNEIKSSANTYDADEFDDLFKSKYPLATVDFNSFISQFKSKDWAIETISRLNEGDPLTVNGFIADDTFICRANFVIDDMNFLFFSNDNDCFYLIQHSTNIALFFPIYFGSISLNVKPWIEQVHSKLPRIFKYLVKMGGRPLNLKKECPKFSGLLLANSRPYHFFYDYMYGLSFLIEKTNRKFKAYGVHGMDFFPIDSFHSNVNYQSKSEPEIIEELVDKNTFLIMPCVQYTENRTDHDFSNLSSELINKFSDETELSLHGKNYDLVIWIGISTEKRSWIEQTQGFLSILNKLSKKYNKILALVDGRTFPLNPREVDINCKKTEDHIFNELKTKNKEIDFLNMIGLTSSQKILLATKIDFFISSYATDSIYPSAICQKPGVVYIAPSAGDQKHLHIHHKIIEVPCEKITEVIPKDSVRKSWHETSISMDWRDVYKCVLQLIDKHEIRA